MIDKIQEQAELDLWRYFRDLKKETIKLLDKKGMDQKEFDAALKKVFDE